MNISPSTQGVPLLGCPSTGGPYMGVFSLIERGPESNCPQLSERPRTHRWPRGRESFRRVQGLSSPARRDTPYITTSTNSNGTNPANQKTPGPGPLIPPCICGPISPIPSIITAIIRKGRATTRSTAMRSQRGTYSPLIVLWRVTSDTYRRFGNLNSDTIRSKVPDGGNQYFGIEFRGQRIPHEP